MEIFVSYLFCLVNVDTFVAGFGSTTELMDHLTHASERIGCMLCANKRKAYELYALHLLSVWFIPVSIVPCFFLPHIGEFVVRVARRHYLLKHRALIYKQQYRRVKVLHFRTMQTLLPKLGEGERVAMYEAFRADYTIELGGIEMQDFLKIDFSAAVALEYVDPKMHSSDMPFTTDPGSDKNMPDDAGATWFGRNPFTPFQLVSRLAKYFFPTPSGTPGIPDCFASVEMQTTPRVFSKPIVNEFREFTTKKTNLTGFTVILPILVSRDGQVAMILSAFETGSRFGYPFLGTFGLNGCYSVPRHGYVNAHHGEMIFFMCTGKDEPSRRREFNVFDKVRKGEWTQPIQVHISALEFVTKFFSRPAPVANTPRLLEYNWTVDQSRFHDKMEKESQEAANPQPPPSSEPKKEEPPKSSWGFSSLFSRKPTTTTPEEKKELPQQFQTKPRSSKQFTYTIMYGMLIDLDSVTWNGEYNTFLHEVAANSDNPSEAKVMVKEHIAVGAKLTHKCFEKRIVVKDVVDAQFWAKQQPDFCGYPYVVQRPGQKNKSAIGTNTTEELQKVADEVEKRINEERVEQARKHVEEVKAKASAKSTTPPPTVDEVEKHVQSGQSYASVANSVPKETKPVGYERKEKHSRRRGHHSPSSPQWGDPTTWKVAPTSDFVDNTPKDRPRLHEPDYDYDLVATQAQKDWWHNENVKLEKEWMLTHPEYVPKYAVRSREETC